MTLQGKYVRFAPVDLPDSRQVRLNRLYPKSLLKAGTSSMLVPRPSESGIGGKPLRDGELLDWAHLVVDSIVDPADA